LLRGNVTWHGVKLEQPDWSKSSHSIAFTVEIRKESVLCYVILNAYWHPLEFELPRLGGDRPKSWRRWIDTALESPRDIVEREMAETIPGNTYRAESRSVAVLFTER